MATSAFQAFVEGGIEGQANKRKQLMEKARLDLEKSKQLAEIEMKSRLTGAMPQYDDKGIFSGFGDSPNKPAMESIVRNVAPEFFAKRQADQTKPTFGGIPAKSAPVEPAIDDRTKQINEFQKKAGRPFVPEKDEAALSQLVQSSTDRAASLMAAPMEYQEKPLLSNPQEAKSMAITKGGKPVDFQPGAKLPIAGAEPQLVDGQKVAPVAQMEEFPTLTNEFDVANKAPAQASAPQAAAAQAPAPEPDYSLPWEMLGRVADYATTARAKDTNRQYFVGQLPEPLQREILGKGPNAEITAQEQSLPIPEAAYVELLKRGTKSQQGAVRPDVAAAVDEVINGRLSMADFYQNFQNITQAEAKLFDRGFGFAQKNAGMKTDPQVQQWADKTLADLAAGKISRDLPIGVPMTPGNRATIDLVLAKQRQKISEDNAIRAAQKFNLDQNKLSPKQENEFNALSEMEYYIGQAKSQVDNGLVNPRNILAVSQSMGITGGPFVGPMNWIYEAVGDKAITPEEFNFLRSISQNNLSNLVSKAGTTFTEGFMKRINNLGADVSNPARFRASVDFIMKEISQKQQMIVRNAKLNKAGKLGSELEDRPSQSQAPKEYKPTKTDTPTGTKEGEEKAKKIATSVNVATARRQALKRISELEQQYKGDNAKLQAAINAVKNRFSELYPDSGGLNGAK